MSYDESQLLEDDMIVVRSGGLVMVVPRRYEKAPSSVLQRVSVLSVETGTGQVRKTRHTYMAVPK